MTDSIRIFEPGFQVTNSSNTPQSGAVLRFFNAGTSDTRTVYSNSGLTSSLGVTVTCNSAGRPASGGNEVSIFTGITAYKVTTETSAAVSLWSFDNQLGAIDTSGFSATSALPETPVLTKTGDYTILAADKGNVINFNAASNATATLPSAVTMGDGWRITIRNTHETTTAAITPVGGQTVNELSSYTLYNKNDGVTLVSDAANWHIADSAQPAIGHWIRGHLFGLTLSNNGTDATNDIDIAIGSAASSDTVPALMVLASSITKRLDAAWAVGTGNGGLDTGSIANDVYHIWLIMRSDTGVVDALFSASATAPTMPTGYDKKRRIGSIIRASAAILAFTQIGDKFLLDTPVLDITNTADHTTAVTGTLASAPDGVQVVAILSVGTIPVGGSAGHGVFLSSLDQANNTPNIGAVAPGVTVIGAVQDLYTWMSNVRIVTNTSAQIRYRSTTAGMDTVIVTHGWIDSRGRLA